jgi:hypothetical protein
MSVEQIKTERSGIGLRAVDHSRAFPGNALFAPQSGEGRVYLIEAHFCEGGGNRVFRALPVQRSLTLIINSRQRR